jgi:hypothetical protein
LSYSGAFSGALKSQFASPAGNSGTKTSSVLLKASIPTIVGVSYVDLTFTVQPNPSRLVLA